MKFSSLAALEVVKMTTSSADSDKNFIKITFSCQWYPTEYAHHFVLPCNVVVIKSVFI